MVSLILYDWGWSNVYEPSQKDSAEVPYLLYF